MVTIEGNHYQDVAKTKMIRKCSVFDGDAEQATIVQLIDTHFLMELVRRCLSHGRESF